MSDANPFFARRLSNLDFGYLDGMVLSWKVTMHIVPNTDDALIFQFNNNMTGNPVYIQEVFMSFYNPEDGKNTTIVRRVDALCIDVLNLHRAAKVARRVLPLVREIGNAMYKIRCVHMRVSWGVTCDSPVHKSETDICYGILQPPCIARNWKSKAPSN